MAPEGQVVCTRRRNARTTEHSGFGRTLNTFRSEFFIALHVLIAGARQKAAAMVTIVATDTLADYARAALLCLQEPGDGDRRYPLLGPPAAAQNLAAALSAYGRERPVRVTRFADKAMATAPPAPAMRKDAGRDTAALLAGFVGATHADGGGPAEEAGARLTVGLEGSAAALAAAYHAAATGRRFRAVKSLAALESSLRDAPPGSLILAGDAEAFPKSVLARLLAWSISGPTAPRRIGILSGRTPAQVTTLVAKLLIHRDFRAAGGRLETPPDLAPIPLAHMRPMSHYVLGAHGNEMHLDHVGDEILCGAPPEGEPAARGFDCRVNCAHLARVAAQDLPVHAAVILSCDAFTLGGGLAPPEVNLLYRLLDGLPANVLAPFKHVQLNEGLIQLADALLKSGFALGDVAARLNARARQGARPDPAYLVLGDPDHVVGDGEAPPAVRTTVVPDADGTVIEAAIEAATEPPAVSPAAIEIPLPDDALAGLPDPLPSLGLEPLSPELRGPDVYYAIGPLPGSNRKGVLLFSANGALGASGPLRFRIGRAEPPDADMLAMLKARLGRMALLRLIGLESDASRAAEAGILGFLRAAAAFPRPVELAMGQSMVRHVDALTEADFAILRRAGLDAALRRLERKRLWISQGYAQAYPLTSRADAGGSGACPHCGEGVARWRYEDSLTGLPSRDLTICDRCGIIADSPADTGVEIALETVERLATETQEQCFTLRNASPRPVTVGYRLQFNEWKTLGVEAEDNRGEVTLAPGEETARGARFRFPHGFPDDIVSMQLFAMDDDLHLHFRSQKMRAAVRPRSAVATEEARSP